MAKFAVTATGFYRFEIEAQSLEEAFRVAEGLHPPDHADPDWDEDDIFQIEEEEE